MMTGDPKARGRHSNPGKDQASSSRAAVAMARQTGPTSRHATAHCTPDSLQRSEGGCKPHLSKRSRLQPHS
eukprot:349741-Chlamydomonas_euryale.AAC.2